MRNDFIEHSAKGHTWSNHRYIAKVRLPSGRMFYFYDQKAYQAYLNRQSGTGKKTDAGQLARKEPYQELKSTSTSLRNYSSQTTEQKKQTTSQYINTGKTVTQSYQQKLSSTKVNSTEAKKAAASGKAKTDEILNKANNQNAKADNATKTSTKTDSDSTSTKSSGKKSGSSSSSKKGKSSSGSSKKSSSKTKSAGSSKEKSGSSKSSSEKKSTEKQKEEKKVGYEESLKKMLGLDDHDVNEYTSAKKFLDQLSSYRDGTHGYCIVGDKAIRWTKEHGKITLIDVDTGKEISTASLNGAVKEYKAKR